MDTKISNMLCKFIYDNLEGEQSAMSGYAKLLTEEGLDFVDAQTIREIIGDESNHTIKLLAMAKKYNQINATGDALESALQELANGVQFVS